MRDASKVCEGDWTGCETHCTCPSVFVCECVWAPLTALSVPPWLYASVSCHPGLHQAVWTLINLWRLPLGFTLGYGVMDWRHPPYTNHVVNNLHGQHLYAWAAIRDVQIRIDQGHRCKWLTSCCCLSSPSLDVVSDNSNSVSVSYTLVFAFELFHLLISIIFPQCISWQRYSPQNVGTNWQTLITKALPWPGDETCQQ